MNIPSYTFEDINFMRDVSKEVNDNDTFYSSIDADAKFKAQEEMITKLQNKINNLQYLRLLPHT